MRNPFDDDARRTMLDDDDVTPIDGAGQPPRGRAQRGKVAVALEICSGEFEYDGVPTPDPLDLRIRRIWPRVMKVVREE